ncbi:1,4-dihydroxy-2-naphthoyl-CoA thioesterase 1-like [Wolffia australiana]
MAGTPEKTVELDAPLSAFGFQFEELLPNLVSGRFTVTPICCQPFKVLHGGLSALVAEALASIGAHIASGFHRVAGVQLSINHHRPAALGEVVAAEAQPVSVGKTIQVWEVRLYKVEAEEEGEEKKSKGPLLASSRVTLLTNLPVTDDIRGAAQTLRKHAKL